MMLDGYKSIVLYDYKCILLHRNPLKIAERPADDLRRDFRQDYPCWRGLRSGPLVRNNELMTAHVYVTLKRTVLDAQGQTVQSALRGLGHSSVGDVRQGKFFEIELHGLSTQAAQVEVDQIAREVLSNPVIEDYRAIINE